MFSEFPLDGIKGAKAKPPQLDTVHSVNPSDDEETVRIEKQIRGQTPRHTQRHAARAGCSDKQYYGHLPSKQRVLTSLQFFQVCRSAAQAQEHRSNVGQESPEN